MKRLLKIIIPIIFIGAFIFSIIEIFSFKYKEGSGNFITYNCDVKNIRVTTDIEIFKNSEYIRNVKGRLTMITDPLKIYDADENKLGYAGDDYAFINQDSHLIIIDNDITTMRGKFKIFGDVYELYDKDENYIGRCEFNALNTKGYITNANGEVIANYKSKLFFNDYDVLVYENCDMNDDTILLFCASYYSDQKFDARSQNKN